MSKAPIRVWYVGDLANVDYDRLVELSSQLTEKVSPLFFGKHPGVQMLSLIDLVAIWVSGHRQDLQDDMLASLDAGVREMLACLNKEKEAKQRHKNGTTKREENRQQ
jgi:hypothetical protein